MRGASLKNLTKMIEVLETKARNRPVNQCSIARLGGEGQLKRADRWHYNAHSKVLSNGYGKSNVASTPISLKELVVAGMSAFHHEMFFSWMKKQGVPLGGGKRPLVKVGDAIKNMTTQSEAKVAEGENAQAAG